MGADFSAYAFIGVEIDKRSLYVKGQQRACKHALLTGAEKFCPVCGKPAWVETEEPIAGYNEYDKLHGLRVVYSTDSERVFACVDYAGTGSNRIGGDTAMVPLPASLVEVRHKLYDVLQPLGMWDEKRFGIHAILHCSY